MDEFEISETENLDIKEIELYEGNNKYNCIIEKLKDYLNISVSNKNIKKYEGNIHLTSILYNLGIYNFNILTSMKYLMK